MAEEKISCPKCKEKAEFVTSEGHTTEDREYTTVDLYECTKCFMKFYI